METITYKPDPGRLKGRRLLSIIFVVMGGSIGLLTCVLGLIMAIFLLAMGIPVGLVPILAASIGAVLLGAIFVGVGFWMWRAQASGKEEVTLSPTTFTYTDQSGTTTLHLSEIVAVDAEWRPGHRVRHPSARDKSTYYPAYWTLIVRDRQGQSVRLQIAFPGSGRMTRFDVLPILRNLLARLPDHVPVDPYMFDYAQTGTLPRPD